MPCYDHRLNDYEESLRAERDYLEERIHLLTSLLCNQCRYTPDQVHPDVQEWWEEHKLADAARAEMENELKEINNA